MIIKPGVNINGVQPPTWYAIGVLEQIYRAHGQVLVITSLTDGVHPDAKNIHGNGFAADLRTSTVPLPVQDVIVTEAKAFLYQLGYDIVHEADHIHCEYDPKPTRASWYREWV